MSYCLKVENLSSHYGEIEVLNKVSLSVESGKIISIIGANGAGKSTFLRTISGLQPIHSGNIIFNGKSINHWETSKRIKAGLSHVLEGRQLFSSLSVENNLEMGAYLRNDSEVNADFEKIYNFFPILKEKRKHLSSTLSGGQQQMLAIARALMNRPQFLLLDEPSMGLSPLLQSEIFQLILSLKKKGITILLVEQNAFQAMQISDHTYVLENGEITLSGESSKLLNNDKVRNAYLGG